MRRSSRAVALLLALESAEAAATATSNPSQIYQGVVGASILVPFGGPDNSAAGSRASRTAPYNPCAYNSQYKQWQAYAPSGGTAPCPAPGTSNSNWPTTPGSLVVANRIANKTYSTTPPPNTELFGTGATADDNSALGSKCVMCIQNLGVWCSRTFSFSVPSPGAVFQFEDTANNNAKQSMLTTPDGTLDGSACCGVTGTTTEPKINQNLNTTAGSATGLTSTVPSNLRSLNAYACPAFQNVLATTSTMDAPVINQSTAAYGSWWCSNGAYNLVTASGTNSLFNNTQVLPDNANQRLELALAGCPQLAAQCGAQTQAVDALTAPSARAVPAAATPAMTKDYKCTWVAYGLTSPPAFSIAKNGSSAGLLYDTASSPKNYWIIHHMEYNSAQLPPQAAADYITGVTDSTYNTSPQPSVLDFTSKVPQFTMSWYQYAKQRTWYGRGTSATGYADPQNWQAPYWNNLAPAAAATASLTGAQWWGSVASFASSVAGTDYTTATGFDQRVVRYMPYQVAYNSNAMGTSIKDTYSRNVTTYNNAKTNWNNYVAILKKNSNVDAFSAAFAPPKAPSVPALPNFPWQPDVSATLSELPYAQQNALFGSGSTTTYTSINSAVTPTTSQFWVDEASALATGGGWGSFTAAVIRYRESWGKSYGTIGWEATTVTDWDKKGAVYDRTYYCGDSSALAAAITAGTCPASQYSSMSSISVGTAAARTTANSVTFYVALSVWSEGESQDITFGCTAGTTNCFTLTFHKGTWSSTVAAGLQAPVLPSPPGEASSLSGVVRAQALTASAAAALAAAAVLY